MYRRVDVMLFLMKRLGPCSGANCSLHEDVCFELNGETPFENAEIDGFGFGQEEWDSGKP